jgi:hypothetical protein
MKKSMDAGVSPRKAMAMGMYHGDSEDVTLKGGGKKLPYVTDGDHNPGRATEPMRKKPAPRGGRKGY